MPAELRVPVLTVDELEDAVAVHDSEQGRKPGCFRSDKPPAEPGVYVWSTGANHKVLYIGSAANLNKRIGEEREWLSFDPNHNWADHRVEQLHGQRLDRSSDQLARRRTSEVQRCPLQLGQIDDPVKLHIDTGTTLRGGTRASGLSGRLESRAYHDRTIRVSVDRLTTDTFD